MLKIDHGFKSALIVWFCWTLPHVTAEALPIYNRHTFDLQYDASSAYQGVECFYSRDHGKTWHKASGVDTPPTPGSEGGAGTFRLQLNEDGVYGVILRNMPETGETEVPEPGTPPHLALIVDTKAPAIRLSHQFQQVPDDDASVLLDLQWATEEDHPPEEARGVMEWRYTGETAWRTHAQNLPDSGKMQLHLTPGTYSRIAIRMTQRDRAANVGIKEVWLDIPRPPSQTPVASPGETKTTAAAQQEAPPEAPVGRAELAPAASQTAQPMQTPSERQKVEYFTQAEPEILEIPDIKLPIPMVDFKKLAEEETVPGPRIRFLSDRLAIAYQGGSPYVLRWKIVHQDAPITKTTVAFSSDRKKSWETIHESEGPVSRLDWTLPKITADSCYFRVTLEDEHGEISQTDSYFSIAIDSTAPSARIIGKTRNSDGELQLKIRARDTGLAGVGTTYLWVKVNPQQDWQILKTLANPYMPAVLDATDGHYDLLVTAEDLVGNREPDPDHDAEPEFSITLDSQRPSVNIPLLKLFETDDGAVQMDLAWIAEDANLAPKPVSLRYSPDNGDNWMALQTNVDASGNISRTFPGFSSSNVMVKVTALDLMGNVGEAVLQANLVKRAPLPAVKIQGPSVIQKHKAPLEIAYPEGSRYIDFLELWHKENGGAWKRHSRFKPGSVPTLDFQEGIHALSLVVVNTDGRSSASPDDDTEGFPVRVDRTPPQVLILPMQTRVLRGGDMATVQWEATDSISPLKEIRLQMSDAQGNWTPVARLDPSHTRHQVKMPLVSAGRYRFKVIATDSCGNTGSAVSIQAITVDADAPVARVTGPVHATSKNVVLNLQAADRGAAGLEKIVIWGRRSDQYNNPKEKWRQLATSEDFLHCAVTLDDGFYHLTAQAYDRVSNAEPKPTHGDPGELLLTVSSSNPEIALLNFNGGEKVGGGSSVEIEWQTISADQTDDVHIELSLDGGKQWQTITSAVPNKGRFLWLIPKQDSDHALLRLTLTNRYGQNAHCVSQGAFTIDSTPPSLFAPRRTMQPSRDEPAERNHTISNEQAERKTDQAVLQKMDDIRENMAAQPGRTAGSPWTDATSAAADSGEEKIPTLHIDKNFLEMPLTGDLSDYHYRLGYVYYSNSLDQFAQTALREFQKAIKHDPNKKECFPLMAHIYEHFRDREMAEEFYQKTIDAYGADSEQGKEAMRRLSQLQ